MSPRKRQANARRRRKAREALDERALLLDEATHWIGDREQKFIRDGTAEASAWPGGLRRFLHEERDDRNRSFRKLARRVKKHAGVRVGGWMEDAGIRQRFEVMEECAEVDTKRVGALLGDQRRLKRLWAYHDAEAETRRAEKREKQKREAAMSDFLAEWENESGPVDEEAVVAMARRYGLIRGLIRGEDSA